MLHQMETKAIPAVAPAPHTMPARLLGQGLNIFRTPLMAVLGDELLTGGPVNESLQRGNGHHLLSPAHQGHLDVLLTGIPVGLVGKVSGLKISAQFPVQAHQKIPCKLGGDSCGIVIGCFHGRDAPGLVHTDQELAPRSQQGSHVTQEGHGAGAGAIAQGAAGEKAQPSTGQEGMIR